MNPLHKRYLRELRQDFSKYLVIFILLVGTISLISGFLVADESMIKAYDESFEKYQIEDGHLLVNHALNDAQKKSIENNEVIVNDLFYKELKLKNETKLRVYKNRTEVNLACIMKGRLAKNTSEIAIDRMFAENNHLTVGDEIGNYKIVGLVALSDYSCLFENNNDIMFDAIKFGVGVITPDAFDNINERTYYQYTWNYMSPTSNPKKQADKLLEAITQEMTIDDYVPQYLNQAITFTGEDMGSDKAMMQTLLYILITIIAFVFTVTISNTIVQESQVIGTLRASGFTKKELVIHYMTLPLIVTFISAIIGNIIGYTIFKDFMAQLYYSSYSLPTYVTILSPLAFLETTVIPLILMFVINLGVLSYKLSYSPLQFIRKDLKRRHQHKAIRLPSHLVFFNRFRIRIILQNLSNYIVLFIGILFANILLFFGLGFPDMLNNYTDSIQSHMISQYQYILKAPIKSQESGLSSMLDLLSYATNVETSNEEAEKFMAYSLKTLGDQGKIEEITLYGIIPHSQYVKVSIPQDTVYISSAYSEKYDLHKGDQITLKESYDTKKYTFKISGIYDYSGAVCIFMNQKDLNHRLDLEEDMFAGYFSQSPITDIDEQYIGSVIDKTSLTKVTRQLKKSMGQMMYVVDVISLIMSMILIYLLSKVIIEKNALPISMTKILGYTDKEITQLYIVATSIVTLLWMIISLPVAYSILVPLFTTILREEMTGWISLNISYIVFIKVFVYSLLTYIFVVLLEYQKIKKVPMQEALKNRE